MPLNFKARSFISKLSHYSFMTIFLLTLVACQSREFIKYQELSFEEKSLYDATFKEISSRCSAKYSHIIAKKSIVAKRNSDWVHKTAPQLPKSFKNTVAGDIIHSASNATFQLNIGHFIRSEKNIYQYGQMGNNISVGYGFHGPMQLSLVQYIYQDNNVKIGLKKQIDQIKSTIKDYHSNSKIIKEEAFGEAGIHLLHKYNIGEQEVYSANYLFLSKKWVINVNAIFPIANKAAAELEIKEYLQDMPFPQQ